jgi:hypothetical protein
MSRNNTNNPSRQCPEPKKEGTPKDRLKGAYSNESGHLFQFKADTHSN